jgi:hypothetical protein
VELFSIPGMLSAARARGEQQNFAPLHSLRKPPFCVALEVVNKIKESSALYGYFQLMVSNEVCFYRVRTNRRGSATGVKSTKFVDLCKIVTNGLNLPH